MSKLMYICPTCTQSFQNKKHITRHLSRMKGCISPESLLADLAVTKIAALDKNFEMYSLFYLEMDAKTKRCVLALRNRYCRLIIIKRNIELLQLFINGHCVNLYNTDEKREAIKEIMDDFHARYKVFKDQYVIDKTIDVTSML